MSGIYIHIPFCRRKCHYCNFFSLASLKYKDRFLEALKEEVYLRKEYLDREPVGSVYLGGGTPSLLKITEIEAILDNLRKCFPLSRDCEITLEANPDDLTPDLLVEYRHAGINRLSIGVQSFFDDDLTYLNRIHSAQQAEASVIQARDAGFSNISIDLIYGIPTLSTEKWKKNLKKAFSMMVPHISAYSLTVESKTALDLLIRQNKLPGPQEEQVIEHFQLLLQLMKENEFEHYEISNFCKKGHYSRHNSMYWSGTPYLGLGPSAHSYNGLSRQWNISNLVNYTEHVMHHDVFFESEDLSQVQKYNEYVMVSLRTMWGCDSRKIKVDFGDETASWFTLQVASYVQSGDVVEKSGIYFLTDKGKLFADGIASDLFLEPEESSER